MDQKQLESVWAKVDMLVSEYKELRSMEHTESNIIKRNVIFGQLLGILYMLSFSGVDDNYFKLSNIIDNLNQ